jgi:hypothetical protein
MNEQGVVMDSLRAQLIAMGCDASKFDDKQVKDVARVLHLEVPPEPRQVKIVKNEKNGLMYVSTDAYVVPSKTPGKQGTARPLYLRVEAIDQAIEDLLLAKGLLATK